jgi:NhaA family Na+:H+ antiporter
VLVGSLLAAVISGVFLRSRSRRYAALALEELVDRDADGVPDVYEPDPAEGAQSSDPEAGSRRVD